MDDMRLKWCHIRRLILPFSLRHTLYVLRSLLCEMKILHGFRTNILIFADRYLIENWHWGARSAPLNPSLFDHVIDPYISLHGTHYKSGWLMLKSSIHTWILNEQTLLKPQRLIITEWIEIQSSTFEINETIWLKLR